MTSTSKSTDSQSHELSLTELDRVNGGVTRNAIANAVAAALFVGLGPVAGGVFLSYYIIGSAVR